MEEDATPFVKEIMTEFAVLTGLSPTGKVAPQRYLWTDAFAVCNFLELYRRTSDEKYRHLTLHLVDQVHNVLGRHRKDGPRTGWISGLDEQQGSKHPTKGGLRIGKQMNERSVTEPVDERLEWDRDGQYYHYLTKWMHALNSVSRVTGKSIYNIWAIELAKTAHAGFTHIPSPGGPKHMYWKMSIDLSYPLVTSMGLHDPLDGFLTYHQLQATAEKVSKPSSRLDLNAEIADLANSCKGKDWVTDDPLGIGGLLCDAFKLAQLIIFHHLKQADLLETLLDSSLRGLGFYARRSPLDLPVDYRLAFRELGLSLGLRAVKKLHGLIEQNSHFFHKQSPLHSQVERLMRYSRLREQIETFWCERTNREANNWMEHRHINMVMLATSLSA